VAEGLKPGKTIEASSAAAPRPSIVIGGVLTYHTGGSTGPDGRLSISVTLSAAIPTTGFVSVTITYTDGTSDTIPAAILVSKPQDPTSPAYTQAITISPSPRPLRVGEDLDIVVYNFPAGTTVNVYLGSRLLTTISADGNGAGRATTSVPPLPGLTPGGTPITYSIRAVDTYGLQVSLPGYTIARELRLFIGTTPVTPGTFVDHGAVLRLVGTGLRPLFEYTKLTLSFAGVTYDIVVDGLVVSVPVGDLTATGVRTDASGSFEVRFVAYLADPAGVRPPTGTTVTVSMSPDESLTAPTFMAVGVPTFAGTLYTVMAGAAFYHSEPGASVPAGGVIIRNLVPGRAYQLFIGGSPVTLGGTGYADRFIATAAGESPATMTFAAPTSPGVYMLCVRYYMAAENLACIAFIVSQPTADTADDRAILVTPTRPAGLGILVRAFNLPAGTPVSLYVSGIPTPVATVTTTATGAAAMWSSPLELPRGVYNVRLVYGPNVLVPTPSTVTIIPRLIRSPASGPVGTSVSLTAMGLDPNTAYRVVFENLALGVSVDVALGVSNDRGTLTATFTVPAVPDGDYSIKVVDAATGATLAEAPFRVVPVPADIIFGSASPESISAFPGQILTFRWTVGTGLKTPVYVTVYLNGFAYTTIEARYDGMYLYGSFQVPNAPPGTTWTLRLEYRDSRVRYFWLDNRTGAVYSGYTLPSTLVNVTAVWTVPEPNTGASGTVALRLVSGSGALVIGLSDADVSRIASAVFDAVYGPIVEVVTSTGDRVLARLSDLDAKIVEVRGGVALLNTRFGEMFASLSAINATLSGLIVSSKGEVLARIDTALGTVLARLDALDARLVAVHGDTAVIRTMVGEVKLALGSLNATIAGIKDDVVVIKTDVGFIKAKVEELIALLPSVVEFVNATVTDIKSGVEAIKSDTGFIKAKVEDIIALLSAASTTLSNVAGDVSAVRSDIAAVRGDIAEVKALVLAVNDNVGLVGQAVLVVADLNMAVLDRLDKMNATLVGVSAGVAKLSTDVAGLASLVKAANLSISQIVVDQAGRIVVALRDSEGRISGLITTNAKTLSDLITAVGKDVAGVADSVKKVSDTLAAFQSGTFSKLDAISGSVDAARADLARLRTDAAAMASVVAGIQTTVSRIDTNVGGLVDTAKAIATTVDSINRAVPGLATKADVSGAQTAITGAVDRAKSDVLSAVKSAETAASTSARNWGVINAILIIIAIAILAYSTFIARKP
jgi:archaellum component FlaC